MTVRWSLGALIAGSRYRGNQYCSASALAVDSGSFNFSTESPIIPPGDNPCVMVTVDISSLVLSATGFSAHGGFSFRSWLDAETAWTIEVANTGSPDVDNEAHWDAVTDDWGLKLPGPAGRWVMALAGQAASNNFNPYTQQIGGEAFIPLQTAGTYRVKAVFRLPDGAGSYVTATHKETLTATAYSGTIIYYDADAGNNGNDGLTEGAPKLSGWGTYLSGGNNRAVLLKTNNTTPFADGGTNWRGRTNIHVGVWGTTTRADRALINPNGGLAYFRYNMNDASTSSGNTVCNLDVDINTNAAGCIDVYRGHASCVVENLTWYNCKFRNPLSSDTGTGKLIIADGDAYASRQRGFHIFACELDQMDPAFASQGMYVNNVDCVSVVACTFAGIGDDATLDHHMYMSTNKYQLVTLCYSGETGTGDQRRSYFCNAHIGLGSSQTLDAYWLHTLNYIDAGVARGFDHSSSTNERVRGTIDNVLGEGNFFASGMSDYAIWSYNLGHAAFRGNVGVNCGMVAPGITGGDSATDTVTNLRIHDNKLYSESGSDPIMFGIPGGQQSAFSVKGNQGHWTQASSLELATVNFDYVATYSYAVDYNEYYCPNIAGGSDLFLDDNLGGADAGATWAEWQAAGLDPNGTLRGTSFGWRDPANGDFEVGGAARRLSALSRLAI